MLATARKYGYTFDTVEPSLEIAEMLPAFHHVAPQPGARQVNNSKASKCLRDTHHVKTTGDLLSIATRLRTPQHEQSSNCNCEGCQTDQDNLGCTSPHICVRAAEARLNQIHAKWDIRRLHPRKVPAENVSDDAVVPFCGPPQITPMSQGVRVFTNIIKGPPEKTVLPRRRRRNDNVHQLSGPTRVYIYGAVLARRKTRRKAGAGIVFTDDENTNVSLRVPDGEHSVHREGGL
ncbi:hypothetical protein GGX14DRAFT_343684 [Mycena pura]|uniref:Uncharacterized protein n=1 Tax=Mycena pura TaxID=153505 RepID=A0AAD6YU99_9AGAR|nr:hypothetical protein GGX14DRAFT_343684 [Mycena pura]